MATTPTNLPVPSESPRDLKFNAGKIDEFVTSFALSYIDRFGDEHYTIEGLRWLAQRAIAEFGWIPIGTWICPYISRHLLSLNPLLACCRRYSRGER